MTTEHKLQNVRNLLLAIGEDPDREGLRDTPKRVVRSWKELFGGYSQDPMRVLSRTFSSGGYDEMIILREIEFYSCCEHHMQVFSGRASIAYVPKDRVVGVSKLARVVDIYARRLQIQERLTVQIADAIEKALEPQGVMVVLEAQHLCMRARGVKQQHSLMTTSAIRGIFRENPEVREEFLDLLKRGEGEH